MWWLFDYAWGFLDSIQGFLTLIAAGAMTLMGFIMNPQRLIIMAGSGMANMFMRLSTERGIKQAINYRLLPTDAVARKARDHLENAVNRAVRIKAYLDMRRIKKADREGPFALTLWVEDLFDHHFRQWQIALKESIREFDRREDIIRHVIYKLERATGKIRKAYETQLNDLELAVNRQHIRWAIAIGQMTKKRNVKAFWAELKIVREERRKWKALNKAYLAALKERNAKIAQTERRYDIVLKDYLPWLQNFEKRRLVTAVHISQADWASSQQTAECGRTLDRLLATKSPAAHDVRALIQFPEDFPWTLDEARTYMLDQLRGRVGLNPNVQIEDIFETWLRIFYLDRGPEGCPNVEPLGSRGFYDWTRQLVAPGAKGLAHERYGHLNAADAIEWIVPLA